ncbi:hypothetical protein DPMN_061987 [Dreissena polymorpha]|uniref:Uncharacterized protein n=1 Tax=Dreissena polymorpha TaxID=45954 RepID=A0A9D4C8F0_DREPO|nr:hypothetical protein DPMN_061987 [Dreissena polymorpha]
MPADDVTMEVYTYAFNGRRSQTRLNIVAKFGTFVALTETRRMTLFDRYRTSYGRAADVRSCKFDVICYGNFVTGKTGDMARL